MRFGGSWREAAAHRTLCDSAIVGTLRERCRPNRGGVGADSPPPRTLPKVHLPISLGVECVRLPRQSSLQYPPEKLSTSVENEWKPIKGNLKLEHQKKIETKENQ